MKARYFYSLFTLLFQFYYSSITGIRRSINELPIR